MSTPLDHAARAKPDAGAARGDERLQSWVAGLLSGTLHLAILLLAMLAEPVTMQPPQGAAAGGSRVEVVMIGETPDTAPLSVAPPVNAPAVQTPQPPQPDPAEAAPVPPRVQPTPVVQADEAMQRRRARPAASSPPPTPTTHRRAHVWGQPPGMLPQDHAPVNAGTAASPSTDRGRRHATTASETSLEVGGFQVLYDVRSEQRLRQWRDEGITELFLPLPGTRDYMVCPLEIALRRESGACRLLDPDDPEMAGIGDAREVISMHRVYRRGELVWRGPRAYR